MYATLWGESFISRKGAGDNGPRTGARKNVQKSPDSASRCILTYFCVVVMHEIAESPNQLVTVEKWPKFHCAKQNLREWVKKGFPHDNASLHSHWLYTINYFAVARSKLFLDFTEKTFSAVQTNKVRRHTYIHVYTR